MQEKAPEHTALACKYRLVNAKKHTANAQQMSP